MKFCIIATNDCTRRAADSKFGVLNESSTASNRPLKKHMTFDDV